MSLNRKMSKEHETYLAKLLGGRQTRGSGNQWRDPMDGRHTRFETEFAYAWDGKATLSKSVGVSLDMWDKAIDQAGGERPMLALRFYANERLDVKKDLAVVDMNDLADMLCALEGYEAL